MSVWAKVGATETKVCSFCIFVAFDHILNVPCHRKYQCFLIHWWFKCNFVHIQVRLKPNFFSITIESNKMFEKYIIVTIVENGRDCSTPF